MLKGNAFHKAKVSDSAHGTIRSIEYALDQMEERTKALEEQILDGEKRTTDLTTQSIQSFEYESRLSELLVRQGEIADLLDLTKNQASNKLGDEPSEDSGSESGNAVCLREIGFPDYDD